MPPNQPAPPRAGRDPRIQRAAAVVCGAAVLLLVRCTSAPAAPAGPDGTSIVACGRAFAAGTRVVTWHEPAGYDAYREGKHFDRAAPPDGRRRYGRRDVPAAIDARVAAAELALPDLQHVVHQFVLHYDAAGTSRQCFKVLHDLRNLSVHFLLDVDGTIYQTLDLREKAHHATIANDGSIGVEIAHPGAYPQPMNAAMARWYGRDEQGWFMKTPAWVQEPGIRTPGFVARPARPDVIAGPVHGVTYHQLDFTPQQYEALARLCAALARVFPRLRLDAPRTADGAVRTDQLPPAELRAFDGIVGHFHVQKNKQDPGPAFQWDRVLRDARAHFAAR